MNEKLLANIRVYFAQSVFMCNCHFKAMHRLEKKEKNLSKVVAIISSITILSLIFLIIGFEKNIQHIVTIATYIGLLTTASSLIYERFYKSDRIEKIFLNRMYAEKYKTLRDKYVNLIEEIMSAFTVEDQIRKKSDDLQKQYSSIGESAPSIDAVDYEQARAGLGISKLNNEEFTWADSEINKFLPKQLQI